MRVLKKGEVLKENEWRGEESLRKYLKLLGRQTPTKRLYMNDWQTEDRGRID